MKGSGSSEPQKDNDQDTTNNDFIELIFDLVRDVKVLLVDEPERYLMFIQEITKTAEKMALDVEAGNGLDSATPYMKDVIYSSIQRVKALLDGHDDLVLRLVRFLPEHFQDGFSGDLGKNGDGKIPKMWNVGEGFEGQSLDSWKLKFLMQQERAIMCKVEDIKYEKDMWLHWLRLACEYLVEIINGADFGGRLRGLVKEVILHRCIEKIWGVFADDLLELFDEDKKRLAPILLERLEKKVQEMRGDDEEERKENVQKK